MADCVSLVRKNLETLKAYHDNVLSANEGPITDLIKTIRDAYVNYNITVQERGI